MRTLLKTTFYEKWLKLLIYIYFFIQRLYRASCPPCLDNFVCGIGRPEVLFFVAELYSVGGFGGGKVLLDIRKTFLVRRTVQKQNGLISVFFTCHSSFLKCLTLFPTYPKSYLPFKAQPKLSFLCKLFLITQILSIPFNSFC